MFPNYATGKRLGGHRADVAGRKSPPWDAIGHASRFSMYGTGEMRLRVSLPVDICYLLAVIVMVDRNCSALGMR